MTPKPDKLTIEDVQNILTKDHKTPYWCISNGVSGNWYPLAQQLLDIMRENERLRELLYDYVPEEISSLFDKSYKEPCQ